MTILSELKLGLTETSGNIKAAAKLESVIPPGESTRPQHRAQIVCDLLVEAARKL